MKILLVSENYWNCLILIDPIIILQLTPGLWKIYLSLMRTMTERQFLLSVYFIFTVNHLVPHIFVIFLTKLSTVIHCQPQLWRILLLVLSILLKNKGLSKEEYITVLLEVNITGGSLMEGYSSI